MSLIGSSERWGEQSFARLCQIVVDSNDGIGQQVMENRTDLLDLMSVDALMNGDDLGLSASFLAVYYDQPEIIRYLHRRGVNLSQPCDNVGFGNAMFYAVMFSKKRLIAELHHLGYLVQSPCENTFYRPPLHYAKRRDDPDIVALLTSILTREDRAKSLLRKNVLRNFQRREYLIFRKRLILLQSLYRRRLAKRRVQMIKSGDLVLESSDDEEEEEESTGEEEYSPANLPLLEEESGEEDEDDDHIRDDEGSRMKVDGVEEGNSDEDEDV